MSPLTKLLSFCRAASLRLKGVKVGSGLVTYGSPLVHMEKGGSMTLGDNCVLCSSSKANFAGVNHPVILALLRPGAKLEIGDDTGISGGSFCAAQSVKIGSGCLIGANALVTDCDFHALKPEGRRHNSNPNDVGCAPVVIEDNVWLGANVTVLKGVRIGRDSVVAAGSVVTRDLPAGVLAAGVPAKVIKDLKEK
ncbi:acyltransferase [bacterium]|nr:acyltransferase [bacterium]